MKLRFNRKQQYLIYALLSVVAIGYVWFTYVPLKSIYSVIALSISVLGSLFVQKGNIKSGNFFYVAILPLHLTAGVLLSINYFPNLGLLVKVAGLVTLVAMFYGISLVNNIFLVVIYRKNMIPLYRAAVTWLTIFLVVTAIPFFAGVYKLPISALIQFIFIAIATFLFTLYNIWVTGFDSDTKKIPYTESIYLAMLSVFLTGVGGLSVSFFPTEPFLKALYASTYLMFGLGLSHAHLKNKIEKKLVLEYLGIILIFLIILIIFKP
jgi:hypothetical protein